MSVTTHLVRNCSIGWHLLHINETKTNLVLYVGPLFHAGAHERGHWLCSLGCCLGISWGNQGSHPCQIFT